jgi:hypothetical protein
MKPFKVLNKKLKTILSYFKDFKASLIKVAEYDKFRKLPKIKVAKTFFFVSIHHQKWPNLQLLAKSGH